MLTPNAENGRKIVYGTADGIYLSEIQDINRDPVKVVAILDVTQVDVLEEYQLLVVLAGEGFISFPVTKLLTAPSRTTSAYIPSGCTEPNGSDGSSSACKNYFVTHILLQGRVLSWANSRLYCKVERTLKHIQNFGAY